MRVPVLTLAIVVLAGAASAQCASWAEGFGAEFPTSIIRASTAFDDGTGSKLVQGGDFTSIGLRTVPFIAAWDGERWSDLGGGLDGPVGALHVHDFGQGPRLVAGGGFLTAGTTAASHVAVWDGSSWSALGAGFNADVLALETYDDGTGPALYAGGVFTLSGTTSVSRIAKWNGTSWTPLGPGVNSVVRALEVFDPGSGPRLYVGGEFSAAGALSVGRIASWNGSTWSQLGSGVASAVNAIAVYTPPLTGIARLYVGGDFLIAGGVAATYWAAWTGSSWASLPTLGGRILALAVHDEGVGSRLFIGGEVGVFGSEHLVRYDGTFLSTVGSGSGLSFVLSMVSCDTGAGPRLCAAGLFGYSIGSSSVLWDGAAWSVPAGGNGVMSLVIPGVVDAMTGAKVGSRRDLFVCGTFNQAGVAPADHVACWDGMRWSAIGSVTSPGPNFTMAEYDDGTGSALFMGGTFTQVGGVQASMIARWNGSSWSPLAAGTNGYVTAMDVHDDGSGPALYVGGNFTSAGGQLASRVARWNGASWSALGAGVSGVVSALTDFDDGNGAVLYAAGGFVTAGGQTANRIARWNGASWVPLGSGMNGHVWTLAVHDDGAGARLYAGGEFTTAGGQPASRIARWDGSNWSSLGSGMDAGVFTLASHDDGTGPALFAGGAFSFAGGVGAGRMAKWNGVSWSNPFGAFSAGGGFAPSLSAACVWDDGGGGGPGLCFGGFFTQVGSVAACGIAQLRGCRITSFCAGDGLDAQVTTVCPCANLGASGRGCAWHNGPAGASLQASGRIAPDDELVLTASGMPPSAPSTIFLKGDALIAEGVVFGDGVRCAGGNLLRLGTKVNAGGAARYPEASNAPISVRGQTPVGSGAVGYYQTYYRNAASFCTSATFNVTNGVRVVW